jgi:hypothetical protein
VIAHCSVAIPHLSHAPAAFVRYAAAKARRARVSDDAGRSRVPSVVFPAGVAFSPSPQPVANRRVPVPGLCDLLARAVPIGRVYRLENVVGLVGRVTLRGEKKSGCRCHPGAPRSARRSFFRGTLRPQ